MPVVRQMHWVALLPQVAVIAALAMATHWLAPALQWPNVIPLAALVYLIFCRVLRAIFTRDHLAGMQAYHARRFEDAIAHYQASFDFFSAHRRLDAWRSWLFGVASPNPYRVIALCNMAYCHGQIGNGAKAMELYEQALLEAPGCTLARASLDMLRSTLSASDRSQIA